MASTYVDLPLSSGGGGAGDASAANQVTGNNSLASIDGKLSPLTPTHAQSLVVANTGVTTLSKPANARKVKIQAGANAVNLRITVDGSTTPSATVGFLFEPERSEDFDGVGDVKVIAETTATAQAVYLHWSV